MSQLLIGGGEVVAGGLVARDRPQRGVGARRVVGVQGAVGERASASDALLHRGQVEALALDAVRVPGAGAHTPSARPASQSGARGRSRASGTRRR